MPRAGGRSAPAAPAPKYISMNKLHLFYLLVVLLGFTACEESDRIFPEFGDDDVKTGAYARQTSDVSGIFDFYNVENSAVSFDVEFYDVNEGRDVASYDWTATYINNSGGDNVGPVDVLSIPSSSFTVNDFGLPSTTVTFDLSEVLGSLGLGADDINGGDAIRFEATIVMNDGREFTRFNTGSNVISGASFRGTFILDQAIICPSDLAGTYELEATNPASYPGYDCGATSFTGTSTWTETAEGVYSVSDLTFGGWSACYDGNSGPDASSTPGGSLQLQDACNRLTFTGADSFGDSYSITDLTVEGSVLTISWTNTYGESGVATLTRTDGTEWPAELTF